MQNVPWRKLEAVEKAETREASGIQELPDEVIKYPRLLQTLVFFILSTWYRVIINPIPKSSKNDPGSHSVTEASVLLAVCGYTLASVLLAQSTSCPLVS